MTREEAIERIKTRFDKWVLDDEDTKAIQTLIPELAESEDERMIKAIMDALYSHGNSINLLSTRGYTMDDVRAWLEKQKDETQRQFNLGIQAGREEVMYELEKQKPSEFDIDEEVKKYWKSIAGDSSKAEIYFTHFNAIAEYFYNLSHKPAKWSEEDENAISKLVAICSVAKRYRQFAGCEQEEITKLQDWLKSLRPKPHWKPSDEQINDLQYILDELSQAYLYRHRLPSLYNLLSDLKEL